MKQREFYWYKLDNAAKLFPAVSTVRATNVFRLSVRLKENVISEFLQTAVELTLEEMPTFKIKIHKGFFWYYFEENTNKPDIKAEYSYPCRKIDRWSNNGFLFDITYCGKNISCEIFHALCDGAGGIQFLIRIIEHYLQIAHCDKGLKIYKADDFLASDIAQSEDSFTRIIEEKEGGSEPIVQASAYNVESVLTHNNEIKVIKGIMSSSKIRELSKKKGATVTEFFASLLIYSIYLESFRYHPKDKSIVLCIPVNLRQFFSSQTTRNFFTSIAVGINFYKKERTLDEIIPLVSAQFKEQLTEQRLYAKVKYVVDLQKKMYLRFLPLFLKNIGLRIVFAKGEKGYTAVLSNLGNIVLSDSIKDYVDRFEFLLSPTQANSYKTAIASYGDKLVYSFTTNVEDTDIQKRFFSLLVENGIDVTVSCNEVTEKQDESQNNSN